MALELRCRLCGSTLTTTFVDLGMSPPCEDFLTADRVDGPEVFYPLHVRICDSCLLVQLPAYVSPEDVFTDYAYFSSYSESWVEHARRFAERAVDRLQLGSGSLVTEVASNDGYLLQHFVTAGIPVLGIEPALNVAQAARQRGIRSESVFLGRDSGLEIASKYGRADLVVGNNVFAHVPDLLSFSKGLRAIVKDSGTISLEFPHLLRLIERNQFDTIYHEHYSYFTLLTARAALATAGLVVVDVEEIPTHGGSLRVWAQPEGPGRVASASVVDVLEEEKQAGLHDLSGYLGFARSVARVRRDLVAFLEQASDDGAAVVGYGAPGKGNTLLNYCAIRRDMLAFTVDRNPYKHGRFLPGTHIPVLPPEALDEVRPDFVLVLPWNLKAELTAQLEHVRAWGGRLVFPIPQLEII